jgi:Fe-S-cluster containining protein
MREIERLKEEILESFPRLSSKSSFAFACHPAVPCFNDCCRDVTIPLTPYDIVRLKNRLGLSSNEFLAEYTMSPFDENPEYPVIFLRMNEDEEKHCLLVSEDGCRVYEDRPWPCRMYPLGLASPREGGDSPIEEFYFLLEEGDCKGFEEGRTQTVAKWLADQGIHEYNQMGEYFKELTLHEFFREGRKLTPEKSEMFYLACYDLDRFRDLLFNSTFFQKFEVGHERRKRIEEDDVELLKFGHDWLRLALFGEKTLEIRKSVLEARRAELE